MKTHCLLLMISPRFPPVYWVHENTALKWKRQYKMNLDLAFSGQNGETPPDETERLKRRIRERSRTTFSSAWEKATKSSCSLQGIAQYMQYISK